MSAFETSAQCFFGLAAGLLLNACQIAETTPDPLPVKPSSALFTLESPDFVVALTPRFGGRVLEFSRPGEPNLLLVGEAVHASASPAVGAEADFIPYQGHTTWLAPQSAWWSRQDVNPARRDAAAVWPPDPWLVQAEQQVLRQSPTEIVLQGPPSPISGVRLEKSFAIRRESSPAALELMVKATNIRSEPVSWGLWHNTRVPPATRVYVPLAAATDLRTEDRVDDTYGPLQLAWEAGILTIEQDARTPEGIPANQYGKAFLRPSAGWIAAFRDEQCFLVEFPLQPAETIHPEQAQVELFLQFQPDVPDAGLLELEVHAPYRTLAPGETMTARETWTVLPYAGTDSAAAHRAFLHAHFNP